MGIQSPGGTNSSQLPTSCARARNYGEDGVGEPPAPIMAIKEMGRFTRGIGRIYSHLLSVANQPIFSLLYRNFSLLAAHPFSAGARSAPPLSLLRDFRCAPMSYQRQTKTKAPPSIARPTPPVDEDGSWPCARRGKGEIQSTWPSPSPSRQINARPYLPELADAGSFPFPSLPSLGRLSS